MPNVAARNYTPDEILALIVRHRWLLLIPVAIGLAAAPMLARLAPAKYRSQAVILVRPQQVPNEYVQPTMTEPIEDRLPGITARILSRTKLERIILDMDLYKAERSREVMEDVVENMRLKDVMTSAAEKEINSFYVSFVSDDPGTAQKVTERLTDLYIEQNTLDRVSQADNTNQLLTTQLENTRQRLKEQEGKLEAYEKSHPGKMPSQLQTNLVAIQNLNLQLSALSQDTNRALESRVTTQQRIADAQAMFVPQSLSQDVPLSTAQQLEAARTRLTRALDRYTPLHHEVVSAQRTVDELVAKLESEEPLSAKTAAAERAMAPEEAARQKRILDLQAELRGIDQRLAANRAEDARLKRMIADYQNKVDSVPTTQSELVDLTREYNTLLAYYNGLVTKREDAAVGVQMERRQIGEVFDLLDPASRPEKPYNIVLRVAVMASGAVVGLIVGLLVIAFREYRDSSFRSKEEVLKTLSLPVLATIPVMISTRERATAARRARAADLGGSLVLLAAITVVVAWQLL